MYLYSFFQKLPKAQLAEAVETFIENILHGRRLGIIDNTKGKKIIEQIKDNLKCDRADKNEISSRMHFRCQDYKRVHGKAPSASQRVTMHLTITCGFISRKFILKPQSSDTGVIETSTISEVE